jgi:GntR family transcriptional repressor for pyruvate dehydrogenase complex
VRAGTQQLFGVGAHPKVKTGERIARHVVDLVADGTLLPGDQLPAEPELIEQLGVSRGSVREGLRLLEATGVVEVRAGRNGGAFISHAGEVEFANTSTLYLQLGGATYGELLEARELIEPGLAGHAASRRLDSDVLRLRTHLDALGSLDPADPASRAPTVVRFHVDLLRASGNRALALFVGAVTSVWADRLAALIDRSVATASSLENEAQLVGLFEAVEAQDAAGAEKAMAAYLGRLRRGVEAIDPRMFDEAVVWGGPRQ